MDVRRPTRQSIRNQSGGEKKMSKSAGLTQDRLLDDRDRERLAAPLERVFVAAEEQVELVSLDGAAAVDHFDRAFVVTRHEDLGAEREDGRVGGDELAGVVADVLAA